MKARLFLLILLVLGGLSQNVADAANDTISQPAESQLRVYKTICTNQEGEECDFSILKKIDTSPVFGLLPTRKNSANGSNKARSLVNFMFDTRGTDWSKEGADIAIDNDSDVSSDTTLFYRDQLHRDELHWQVISLIARIASALGEGPGGSQAVVANVSKLRVLIGDAETETITKWFTGQDVEDVRNEIPRTVKFDLPNILDAQDIMLAAAVDNDSVITSVKKELQPYANKGKSKRVATKIAYSALGAAAFVPNWIAPIAETSFLGTMMANGGPEQDKLLKELYYAKRLEKRRDLIQRELNLALNTREISVATKNAPLFHFARELTEYLCGEDMEQKLFPEECAGGYSNNATAEVSKNSEEVLR